MSWVQSDHQVVSFSPRYPRIHKTAHRIWLRILSTALEKELKVLDFMLNDHIIIWSPLTVFFCFCVSSLIKLILWLNFSIDKRQAEDMVVVGVGTTQQQHPALFHAYHILFKIYSSTDEHWVSFHTFFIVNNASVNIRVHFFLDWCFCFIQANTQKWNCWIM